MLPRYRRRMRSADSWIGVNGFLISWAIERAISAACALDYPHDRLEIQILDDSTDETRDRAAEIVEELPPYGDKELPRDKSIRGRVVDKEGAIVADAIVVGDLGGNLWKWVIHDSVLDPINGPGDVSQPNWPFVRFFSAESCNSGMKVSTDPVSALPIQMPLS